MKNILLIVVSIILLACATDNKNQLIKKEYKLDDYGHVSAKLFGNIKSIRNNVFEAIEESGSIKKGNMEFSTSSVDAALYENFYNIYNTKGNRVEVIQSSSMDKWLTTKYMHDDEGNEISSATHTQDGRLTNTATFNYDEKGNLIKVNYQDGSYVNFKYDSKGNRIEKFSLFANPLGNSSDKITYKIDSNGNAVEHLSDLYDKNGNVIQSGGESRLNPKKTYQYDGKGNLLKINVDDDVCEFKYEFDINENWIKRVEYKNELPKYIVLRDIEYYPNSKQDGKFEKGKTSEEIENKNVDDYKTLEGTPFHFENYVCSRKLYGQDLIKLFNNHSFYNGDFNMDVHPYVGVTSNGFADFQFIERGSIYEGVIFLSENGEYVYANPISSSVSNRPTVYLYPIQEKGMPFKIKLVVEDEGKKVLSQEILGRCSNYCRLGCSNSD